MSCRVLASEDTCIDSVTALGPAHLCTGGPHKTFPYCLCIRVPLQTKHLELIPSIVPPAAPAFTRTGHRGHCFLSVCRLCYAASRPLTSR
jgi:hypothetical protein